MVYAETCERDRQCRAAAPHQLPQQLCCGSESAPAILLTAAAALLSFGPGRCTCSLLVTREGRRWRGKRRRQRARARVCVCVVCARDAGSHGSGTSHRRVR
jgi:hypothetical protein